MNQRTLKSPQIQEFYKRSTKNVNQKNKYCSYCYFIRFDKKNL